MKKLCVLVLALGLVACDGGGDETDAGGGTDGGDTDGGGGGTPVDVTWEPRDNDDTPLTGVTMAVDMPDGTRVEQVTDASGRATFSIDWAAGPVDVTAHLPGYVIASGVGVTAEFVAIFEDAGASLFYMNTNVPPESVVLSGTITGVADATHRFQVTADVSVTNYNAVGPDYSLEVRPGEAIRVTVLEYTSNQTATNDYTQTFIAAVTIELDAISADTTMDLDLTASPHTFMDVSGTIAAPGTGTPLADAQFYVVVGDLETNEFYGAVSAATPNGADVDYTISFFQPSTAVEPFTRYLLQDEPLFSQVIVTGWPTASASPEFLPSPEVVTPAFGVSHPLHDPFTIGRVTPGVETVIVLFDLNQDDRALWGIISPSGSETITIPELPSSATAADIFPPGSDIYARPQECDRTGANRYCDRFARGGRVFDLVP